MAIIATNRFVPFFDNEIYVTGEIFFVLQRIFRLTTDKHIHQLSVAVSHRCISE